MIFCLPCGLILDRANKFFGNYEKILDVNPQIELAKMLLFSKVLRQPSKRQKSQEYIY